MSRSSLPHHSLSSSRSPLQVVHRTQVSALETGVRLTFWLTGMVFAIAQASIFRFQVSADSISYLDMSDAVSFGEWNRLINGVWSPLYPLLLGVARLVFHVAPVHEIAFAHLLNVAIFAFAFACFEFLLRSMRDSGSGNESPDVLPIPRWGFLSLAYSLFLWASISAIAVRNLRPDMLMSGFLYLTVALMLRMRNHPARWRQFVILGAVLGIGFLAKEPLFPIGVLAIVASVIVVESWRPALKMAAAAAAIMLAIGSLYFVPLSSDRGHFTLGESGKFNYLAHVDGAGPSWYMQNPGRGVGSFTNPPEKIFNDPPTYAFPLEETVTHPLRFDPSDWITGARPHFVFRSQVRTLMINAFVFGHILTSLIVVSVALFGAWMLSERRVLWLGLKATWPAALIGLAGCGMYAVVHVEPRYVAAFMVLFFAAAMAGIGIPVRFSGKLAVPIILVCASLMVPIAWLTYIRHAQGVGKVNDDGEAAVALKAMGIDPGDRVARISSSVSDLGVERIARVEVVAEVDFEHAKEFWTAPVASQEELLNAFTAHGARGVIATAPPFGKTIRPQWKRLGSTKYWLWRPAKVATTEFSSLVRATLLAPALRLKVVSDKSPYHSTRDRSNRYIPRIMIANPRER